MDKKLSQLPIKNNLTGGETIHILDTLDLSDSPEGTDKKFVLGDANVEKIEKQDVDVNVTGNITINDKRAFINILSALGDVTGFAFTNASRDAYVGKKYAIKNSTGVAKTFIHNGVAGSFYFPNAINFLLNENEVIEFIYNGSVFEYIGVITPKTNLTNYYTKPEVDSKITGVYKFKGNVANFASLPSTDLTIGDVYNALDTGDNYAWTGSIWDKLSGVVDVSDKEDVTNKTQDVETDKLSTTKYPSAKGIVDWIVARFQAILVSGVNIRPINGESILGSTNLVITAGQDNFYKNWFSYTASHITSTIIFTHINGALTANGIQSLVALLGTTRLNSIPFLNYLSGTGPGALAGIKNTNNGDGYIRNGYDAYFVFGNNDTNANCQTLVGFTSLLPNFPNVDISAYTGDFQGVGNNVGDANLSFYCKRIDATSSFVKVPLGGGFPANTTSDAYLLRIEAPQTESAGSQFIKMTITNLITGVNATNTFTSAQCPDLNRGISTIVCRSNRNTGVATNIRFSKVHITRNMY